MGILQIASCASKPLGAANRHYPWGIHRQPQRQQGASSCSFEMLWDDIGMRCVCSQSRQPASLCSVQPSFLGISTFRKLINDDTKTQEDLRYLKITEGIFPPVSWTCHFFSTEEKKKAKADISDRASVLSLNQQAVTYSSSEITALINQAFKIEPLQTV